MTDPREGAERRVRALMRTEGIEHTHCLMLQADVFALAQRDVKEHVTDAEQDDIALLAALAEAARPYAGCERPQFFSEGEMAQCGACCGCRISAAIHRADARTH